MFHLMIGILNILDSFSTSINSIYVVLVVSKSIFGISCVPGLECGLFIYFFFGKKFLETSN